MMVSLLKSKIHRATVTGTEIGYVGSVTLDDRLMRAAGLRPYERVMVVDVDNGARLETYCLEGGGPGEVCLNGAAARLAAKGDKVIIMAFGLVDEAEADGHRPRVVFVDAANEVAAIWSV